jgi:hypothetical protein
LDAPEAQPRAAVFRLEMVEPRCFGAAIRFPKAAPVAGPPLADVPAFLGVAKPSISEPPRGSFLPESLVAVSPHPAIRMAEPQPRMRLAPRQAAQSGGAPVRGSLRRAMVLAESLRAAPDSPAAKVASTPRLALHAVETPAGPGAAGGAPLLREAAFLSDRVGAGPSAAQLRRIDVGARWKVIEPVLPKRPRARIIPASGSLIQRPIRPAGRIEPPAEFQIRLEPVSFPAAMLRMASLAGRLHRTDRIGFTPP